jgi:hypothetical protein
MRLEFHPDDNTPGIVRPPERDADKSAPQAASIFTALEQQLGLKLEKTKGPRGFIVIDHIEKPTPDEPERNDLRPHSLDSGLSYWYKVYHDKTY